MSTSSLAARWRSKTSRGSVSTARVRCGPAALDESDVERPGGVAVGRDPREEDDGEHADQGAGADAAGAREQGVQRHADGDHEGDQQQGPEEPDRGPERGVDLGHGHGRQGLAAEGPGPADVLGQDGGAGEPHPPPAPRWAEEGGQGPEAAPQSDGDAVPGQREVEHPEDGGHEPAEGEQGAASGSPATRRVVDLMAEQRERDEGQRPPSPGRHRQRQQRAGQETDERPSAPSTRTCARHTTEPWCGRRRFVPGVTRGCPGGDGRPGGRRGCRRAGPRPRRRTRPGPGRGALQPACGAGRRPSPDGRRRTAAATGASG